MLLFILIFIGYGAVIVPKLITKKFWGEVCLISLVSLLGMTLAGMMIGGVELPKVGGTILEVFNDLYRVIGFNPPSK